MKRAKRNTRSNRRPAPSTKAGRDDAPRAPRIRNPPFPRSNEQLAIRARLVLRDGAWSRLHESQSLRTTSSRSPVLNPCDEADIFLAYHAVGIEGEYCRFLRHVPATPDEMASYSEAIKAASDDAIKSEAIRQFSSKRWLLLDDNATQWDTIWYARGVQVVEPGFAFHRSRKTGSGRVEQFIALSDTMTRALAAFRSPDYPGAGFLRADRPDDDLDLLIGITRDKPVVAAGTRSDFGEHSVEPNRYLSMAGLAVLLWAECQQRLRGMYDSISDLQSRLGLTAITEYLERSLPVLEWSKRDTQLLAAVRMELMAACPLWKAPETSSAVSQPPNPAPILKTMAELISAADISDDTFRRIRDLADVKAHGRGWNAQKRRYSEAEIRAMIETVRNGPFQFRESTVQAWERLLQSGQDSAASAPQVNR